MTVKALQAVPLQFTGWLGEVMLTPEPPKLKPEDEKEPREPKARRRAGDGTDGEGFAEPAGRQLCGEDAPGRGDRTLSHEECRVGRSS